VNSAEEEKTYFLRYRLISVKSLEFDHFAYYRK